MSAQSTEQKKSDVPECTLDEYLEESYQRIRSVSKDLASLCDVIAFNLELGLILDEIESFCELYPNVALAFNWVWDRRLINVEIDFSIEDYVEAMPEESKKAVKEGRLIKAQGSEMGRVNIVELMQQDGAWSDIPLNARQRIYSLLPPPLHGQHDYDVHPLKTPYKSIIARELRLWQDDLISGFETRKWRTEAVQNSMNRRGGAENQWRVALAEEHWGREFGPLHERSEMLRKEKEERGAGLPLSAESKDEVDEAEEALKKTYEKGEE